MPSVQYKVQGESLEGTLALVSSSFIIHYNEQARIFQFAAGASEQGIKEAVAVAFRCTGGTISIHQGDLYTGFNAELVGDWDLDFIPCKFTPALDPG